MIVEQPRKAWTADILTFFLLERETNFDFVSIHWVLCFFVLCYVFIHSAILYLLMGHLIYLL